MVVVGFVLTVELTEGERDEFLRGLEDPFQGLDDS
jgi:hypothetical protein